MHNSMVVFTFSVCYRKYHFWANLVQVWSNCQLKLKIGTYTNSNMRSVMMFNFSAFDWKYHFRANLVQKIKIVSLNWNFVPRLIWICQIQWWCSPFFVFDRKYFFCANLVQKIKIVSLSWNWVPRLIHIRTVQSRCSVFLFLTGNIFGQTWSKKSKLWV